MSDIPTTDADREGGAQLRRHSGTIADAKVGISLDNRALDKLKGKLKELTTEAKALASAMKDAATFSGKISLPNRGTGSGGQYGSNLSSGFSISANSAAAAGQTAAGTAGARTRPVIPVSTPAAGVAGGAAGGSAGGAGGAAGAAAAAIALEIYNKAMGAMDGRIARGVAYATSADRTNMLLQQTTGMSQQGVMSSMRAPLTNYKLGAGGIDQVLQFGASYGITGGDRNTLARSIEALRVSSGYSKSTSDLLTEQQQLMSPEVANRMFYMLGTNAYEIGGGMRDPMQMRHEIIDRMGLANPEMLKGAFTPGSVTRQRMAQAGIGEQLQTEILQLAQQQYQFEQRGGRGKYDPSKKADRQLMGVEDNLANQQEETARLSVAREEKFMQSQIENMTETEKYQQNVVKLLTSMDESLAGLYGARQGWSGALWKGLEGGLLNKVGLGDPVARSSRPRNDGSFEFQGSVQDSSNDSSIYIPFANSARISLEQLKQKPDFQSLDATFRQQLLQMFRANPEIGWGGGSRSEESQAAMFFDRYTQVPEGTRGAREWEGTNTFWLINEGVQFEAAPPGDSWHNLGFAADLVVNGQESWMAENLGRFGLRNFADGSGTPGDEAHHVQPSSIPGSPDTASTSMEIFNRYKDQYGYGAAVSITEESILDAAGGLDAGSIVLGGSSSWRGKFVAQGTGLRGNYAMAKMMAKAFRGTTGGKSAAGSPPLDPNGPITRGSLAKLLVKAGVTSRSAIAAMIGIAGRESGYNPAARRTDRPLEDMTGDFGLFQINYENVNDTLLSAIGASSIEDLLDPFYNVKAAAYLSNNGSNLFPWNAGPNGWAADGDPLYGVTHKSMVASWDAASQVAIPGVTASGDPFSGKRSRTSAITSIEGLDVMPTKRSASNGATYGSSSGSVTVNSSPNITVSPVINFNGSPKTQDLRNIAQTVGRMLKEEVDMLDMRTS